MSGRRVLALYAALLLGFGVVLCRLYTLAQNYSYASHAAAQTTVTLTLPSRRGNFYDCNGLLLTGVEQRWQALCFPGENGYARLYSYTDPQGQALLYRNRNRPAPFLLEVDRDLSALGFRCYPAAQRYPSAPLCRHLIGYLDGEGRGAAALEKALDEVLSGTGAQDVVHCGVTARGTLRAGQQPEWIRRDSGAAGVQLTISRPVQSAAEAVAARYMTTGCILVLDVPTAAVRAWVSVPAYDPRDLAASLEAAGSPFLDRPLACYAAGSVFKPVVAAAGLEERSLPLYQCTGAVAVEGQVFRCAGGVPHGEVDLAAALAKSCNGYFVQLGQQLGAQKLRDYAEALGFGQNIPLAGRLAAQPGQLPSAQELAQKGQLANFSFGQGSFLVTPLQVAAMMNTLAAGGVYRQPFVVQGTLEETTGEQLQTFAHPRGKRVLSGETTATLRSMLVQVVEEGTAQDAKGLPGGAGGKTGTAQTGQFSPEGAEYKNLWFAGFYPAEKPRYTVVVLQDRQQTAAASSPELFARVCAALEAAGPRGGKMRGNH